MRYAQVLPDDRGMAKERKQDSRKAIEIVFGEPERTLRAAFRSALQREGYDAIYECEKSSQVRQHLIRRMPDLVVTDAQLDGEDMAAVIREVRAGHIGANPFVPIIVTFWKPTEQVVRDVVNSGADDMLVKPISPGQLVERIRVIVENRKPFVVTSDYIGPDRRKDPGRESDIPLIEVPNTLRAKMKGEPVDPTSVNATIAEAQERINDQRLKRNAFQVAFLVGLALPSLQQGRFDDPELPGAMKRIVQVTVDTGERMAGTEYDHVSELCESLLEVSSRLAADIANPSRKDIDLLKPLSDAILSGFNPGEDAADMANQITSAISSYSKKQKRSAV